MTNWGFMFVRGYSVVRGVVELSFYYFVVCSLDGFAGCWFLVGR